MGDGDGMINYYDACLYPADIELFSGSNWLNDNCIGVYRYGDEEDGKGTWCTRQ